METFRVTENYFSIEKLRNFLLIEEKRQTKGIRHFLAESEHRLSSLPILIQLSIHPDEIYSFETIESLTKFDFEFSLNVFDSFRSNLLMFTIRFQRLRLFEYFLNELFFHFDFRSKDRRGNTILHYSVIYFPDDLRLFELLIDKFNENHLEIDPRNSFGFTPLILGFSFSSLKKKNSIVFPLLLFSHVLWSIRRCSSSFTTNQHFAVRS